MSFVALIDYGSGNLHSAERALRKAANDALDVIVTSRPERVAEADRIVLPGVGHFAHCADNLRGVPGLLSALTEAVRERAVPFLGICVGQQLLATRGLEDGETPGLNWIPGEVSRIKPAPGMPVPHMGWNAITIVQDHPVLAELGDDPHVYFTHSYAYKNPPETYIAATTDYGGSIIAAVARDNMFATQFHPEKSQAVGLKMLANFVNWTPK